MSFQPIPLSSFADNQKTEISLARRNERLFECRQKTDVLLRLNSANEAKHKWPIGWTVASQRREDVGFHPSFHQERRSTGAALKDINEFLIGSQHDAGPLVEEEDNLKRSALCEIPDMAGCFRRERV